MVTDMSDYASEFARKGGKARADKLTRKQLQEIARKGGIAKAKKTKQKPKVQAIRRAATKPEERKRRSEAMKQPWARRNAILRASGTAEIAHRRKRGRAGEIDKTTSARITVAAYFRMHGTRDYEIAPLLYPLHDTKSAAWNAAKSVFKRHKQRIIEEQRRLESLSTTDLAVQAQTARDLIPRPKGS